MNNIIVDSNNEKGIFLDYLSSRRSNEFTAVEEFLDRFKSKKTRKDYLAELRKFFYYRKEMGLQTAEAFITRSNAVSYIEYLDHEKNLAPKSILKSIAALNSYWEYLLELQIVNSNIFKGLSKKIDGKPLIPTKVLKASQVKEIIDLSKQEVLDNVIITILFYTGMRVSELISLNRNSYREEEELGERFKILIFRAKGDKVLKKVLNERVVEAIERYLSYMKNIDREIKADDHLIQPLRNFYSVEGIYSSNRPISASLINKIIKKYYKLIGIEDLRGYSAHSARTTLVTRLIENGNDIYLVSKEIGHADVATTQRCYDKSKRKLGESLLLDKNIY